MNYSLLKSVPKELEIIKAFLYLALFVPPDQEPPDKSILNKPELTRYYLDWGKKDDRALFAVQGTQVLGVCWSRCFAQDHPGYGTINEHIPELSLAVLAEKRRMGIGSTLLDHFLFQLKEEYEAVSLSVQRDNPARNLYQRFGFQTYQSDTNSLIMMKRL